MTPARGNGGDDDLDDIAPEGDAPAPEDVGEGGLAPVPSTPQAEIEALRRERDELKDALVRRRADFENYKRRVERDQQAAAKDAAADIFRRLVDTVDNLERALAARGGETALRQGVELTLRDLRAVLDAQGVEVVDPLGERFDPSHHQALLHEPVEGFGPGTVAEVLRKGYTFRDRLLRPALVKVSSGPGEGADGGEADGGEDLC
jgi:molecular chaperone GrpE